MTWAEHMAVAKRAAQIDDECRDDRDRADDDRRHGGWTRPDGVYVPTRQEAESDER